MFIVQAILVSVVVDIKEKARVFSLKRLLKIVVTVMRKEGAKEPLLK